MATYPHGPIRIYMGGGASPAQLPRDPVSGRPVFRIADPPAPWRRVALLVGAAVAAYLILTRL